jgi:hypothetical protein
MAKVKDISLKMTPLEKSGTLSKNNKKAAPLDHDLHLRQGDVEG